MTPEQKKRRFRELARHDRIFTARELLADLEQPFLPLINDIVTNVGKFNAEAEKARFSWKPPKPNTLGCP
jgi:hypothetical protein